MSESPAAIAPRASFRSRLLRVALSGGALGLVGIAVLTGGFALGWVAATATVVATAENPDPQIVEVPLSAVSDDVLMPDVRGLDPEGAMQVLADAGVDVADVITTERPAAGASGFIIEQVPAFGTPRPAQIELFVGAPATVPAVVGRDEEDAMAALRELSARVDKVGVYRPGEPVGLVVAVDPAPGERLPAGVVLTVTEAPASLDFSDLDSSGSCSSAESFTIDGEEWATGVTCSSSTSGRTASWEIAGALEVVSGTIGIVDGAPSGSAVRVELVGDGTVLESFDLTPGLSRQFDLSVSGAATLTVNVTSLSGGSPRVGIGEFSGLGTAAKIEGLPR